VIVSRRPGYTVPGATVVASLGDAKAACADESDVFVIGGGEIYRLALPLSDRIYATEIDGSFEGDAFFPLLDMDLWKETRREARRDDNTSMRYSFVTFDRTPPCR
jgi:dihydrofolate reductase